MKMMSARDAKEVTGHFETLSEGGLKRHYGDDEEIMRKYSSEYNNETREKEEEVDDSEE